MKLTFVNIYPDATSAEYLLSSYTLKAYLQRYCPARDELKIKVLNFDAHMESHAIGSKIIESQPDYVAYSCYVWNIEHIADIIRYLNRETEIIHILGGPEIWPKRVEDFKDIYKNSYFVIVLELSDIPINSFPTYFFKIGRFANHIGLE